MNKNYFIPIHVKPYVYRWLMQNFYVNVKGLKDTVSFKKSFELKSMFLALLSNKPYFSDFHRKDVKNEHKSKIVYVYAGQNTFDHSACCMTYTAESLFSSHLESIIKADFISYVTFMYMLEPQISVIVERYKALNGYSEDDWPSLSMLKIVNRKGVRALRDKSRSYFLSVSDDFFTTQLSINNYNKRRRKQNEHE